MSSCLVLYLLIGGGDEIENNASIQYPEVTKLILSRDKVVSLAFALTKLRSILADSSFRTSKSLLRQAMENFQAVMEEIVIMMGVEKDTVSFTIVDDDDKQECSILLNLMTVGKPVKLTFNDDNLVIISEIFSVTKGCVRDAISHELWTFFSLIIGKK